MCKLQDLQIWNTFSNFLYSLYIYQHMPRLVLYHDYIPCMLSTTQILVMTFKCPCQRILLWTFKCPCQRILLCQCFWPVVRQKCTYGNMAEWELLCVRVVILHRNKHTKSSVIGSTCQNCQDFYFNVRDICQALMLPSQKKLQNIDIALAITLVTIRWRANPILICDVNCRCLYICGMWCSRELFC